MKDTTRKEALDFFAGGGELGALMRAYDWTTTPLGVPGRWPQSLRTAIRIMLTTQHPMFIWWGPDLIQFYNDAYRLTMGPERHPSALGQRGRECWQEIWDIIGPQIDAVMKGQGATWHEDHLVPVTRHGRREDVWWTYGFSPIDEKTARNGIGGVLVVCNDVTDRHRAFEALRTSEERLRLALSAGVIGTWDWDVQTDRVFADERFAQAYAVDPVAASAGAPAAQFVASIHPDDRERVAQRIEEAVKSGSEFLEEYRLIQGDGQVRWVAARGRCFHDAAGQPTRFPGATLDITDRKVAEQNARLLTQEMSHRVKNLLATIQAIANQTLRDGISLADARDTFSKRLMSLSRAQDLLTGKTGAAAELRSIIATAIEAHAPGTGRVTLDGPRISVLPRPALALALALHEMATNATKYGALSTPAGRVDIRWHVGAFDAGSILQLSWCEIGGPAVQAPTRKGFGSRLIESVITGDFGGSAIPSYDANGVNWAISAPLAAIT